MPQPLDVFLAGATALHAAGARNGSAVGKAGERIGVAETIWCTGLGKSGLVAKKMAGTLTSLGRRAIAVHPVDALHGDLGARGEGDILVAISQSGRTPETLRVARESGLDIIAICSVPSALADMATVVLDTTISVEAGGALPVTSFLVACAVADAAALAAVSGARGTTGAAWHPGGFVGAMDRPVRDYMLPPPFVDGAAIVASVIPHLAQGAVLLRAGGIFTDGDLRRAVGSDAGALTKAVAVFATATPVTVREDEPAREALYRMERRASQLSVLPVVDARGNVVGLVRLHDLVRAGFGV